MHKKFFQYRGRSAKHDSMPYDPIQGQGHECLKATRGVDRQSHMRLIFWVVFYCIINVLDRGSSWLIMIVSSWWKQNRWFVASPVYCYKWHCMCIAWLWLLWYTVVNTLWDGSRADVRKISPVNRHIELLLIIVTIHTVHTFVMVIFSRWNWSNCTRHRLLFLWVRRTAKIHSSNNLRTVLTWNWHLHGHVGRQ